MDIVVYISKMYVDTYLDIYFYVHYILYMHIFICNIYFFT